MKENALDPKQPIHFFFLEVLCFSTKFYVICSSVVYHTEAVPVLVGTAYDITPNYACIRPISPGGGKRYNPPPE